MQSLENKFTKNLAFLQIFYCLFNCISIIYKRFLLFQQALIKDEKDGVLELFFACSYVYSKNGHSENADLPHKPKDYLKVKGMPKIIFVNGQWNIADKAPFGENFGPTQPKKPYWVEGIWVSAQKYFNLKSIHILNNSELSIEELEKRNYILYYDGSSNAVIDQSGQDRFDNGRIFVEEKLQRNYSGIRQ